MNIEESNSNHKSFGNIDAILMHSVKPTSKKYLPISTHFPPNKTHLYKSAHPRMAYIASVPPSSWDLIAFYCPFYYIVYWEK